SFREGPLAGRVYSINRNSSEIVVQSDRAIGNIPMGSRLYTRIDGKAAVMRATFPMQTVVKCRLEGRHLKYLASVRKGMPVYKYYAGVEGDIKTPARQYRVGDVKTVGGIEFMYIPDGSFMMGSADREECLNECPQHKVTVKGFWMGKYEVTREQYRKIMGGDSGDSTGDNKKPITQVSWNEAKEFCDKFSKNHGVQVRLPYEAEWEYAARAGTSTLYYWGEKIDGNYCWYQGNSGGIIHPVGKKHPNAYGLYDMSGNVWEWCMDFYNAAYYQESPEMDPRGPSWGFFRVIRGGTADDMGVRVRSTIRRAEASFFWYKFGGFRIVISQDGSDTSR
ncbi:MAG TPA: formylglycine-generating enzyme family protein, partial [Spirochaetota bacterium]|nr:formylglycine-generating enzyme family protein [Spirochaetota bacterium]